MLFYDLAEIKPCIVSAGKKKKKWWLPDQVLILMNKSHCKLLAIFSVLPEEGTTVKPFQKGDIPWNASKICVLYVNYASVWKRKGEKKEGRVADISIPLYSVTLGPAKCIVRQSSAEPATVPAILVLWDASDCQPDFFRSIWVIPPFKLSSLTMIMIKTAFPTFLQLYHSFTVWIKK